MHKPTISIIGCGKVGLFLGKLLASHADIKSIVCQTESSAQKARSLLEKGYATTLLSEVATSDFYLIATPEGSIAKCATELAKLKTVRPGQIVFHPSGAYSAQLLAPLKERGALIASLHPNLNIADPLYIPEGFYATIEGEKGACTALKQLFSFHPIAFIDIAAEDKLLHHTALVMVANFVLALIDIGRRLLEQSHTTDPEIMLSSLLKNTLFTIEQKGLDYALSGPISRGSIQLVQEQLALLETINERYALLYRHLSSQILSIVEERKLLPETVLAHMKKILFP